MSPRTAARLRTSLAALGLLGLSGCFEPQGSVDFGYTFLTQDPNDPLFAQNGQDGTDPRTFLPRSCAQIGASTILFEAFDAQGSLVASLQDDCDADGNTPGVFFGDLPAGSYARFEIAVLDAAGLPLPIRALEPDATRLSEPALFGDFLLFQDQLEIESDFVNDLDFLGSGQQGVDLDGDDIEDADELQIFVPFE